MKLPIVSRKKYEILQNNINLINKQRIEITKNYQKFQQEYYKMKGANLDLGNGLEIINTKLLEKQKECANLKRLLTKNGIEYKKGKNKNDVCK